MTNNTMNKETANEIELNELDTVAGGGFISYVKDESTSFWDMIIDFFS